MRDGCPPLHDSNGRSCLRKAKEQASQEAYERIYDRVTTDAERAHHVSNRATVAVEDLREQSELEVLQVRDVDYAFPDEERGEGGLPFLGFVADWLPFGKDEADKGEVWTRVPSTGVFTVDLQKSEFIIDADRQHVLIRVPSPTLAHFAIDYKGVEILNHGDKDAGWSLLGESAGKGEKGMREAFASSQAKMHEDIVFNQQYYQRACDAAERLLESSVRELNPGMPDLVVEVEFVD